MLECGRVNGDVSGYWDLLDPLKIPCRHLSFLHSNRARLADGQSSLGEPDFQGSLSPTVLPSLGGARRRGLAAGFPMCLQGLGGACHSGVVHKAPSICFEVLGHAIQRQWRDMNRINERVNQGSPSGLLGSQSMGAAEQREQSTVWVPGQQNNLINRGCTP